MPTKVCWRCWCWIVGGPRENTQNIPGTLGTVTGTEETGISLVQLLLYLLLSCPICTRRCCVLEERLMHPEACSCVLAYGLSSVITSCLCNYSQNQCIHPLCWDQLWKHRHLRYLSTSCLVGVGEIPHGCVFQILEMGAIIVCPRPFRIQSYPAFPHWNSFSSASSKGTNVPLPQESLYATTTGCSTCIIDTTVLESWVGLDLCFIFSGAGTVIKILWVQNKSFTLTKVFTTRICWRLFPIEWKEWNGNPLDRGMHFKGLDSYPNLLSLIVSGRSATSEFSIC